MLSIASSLVLFAVWNGLSSFPRSHAHLLQTHTQQHNKQPGNVGRVMLWAVTAEKYRPQYLVGMDARFVNMPFLALPRR